MTKTGLVLVCGEISSRARVDFQSVVRDTISHIGYDDSSKGFDYKTMSLLLAVERQSAEIAHGVWEGHEGEPDELGAGDQGLMFGYATDETEECMPLTAVLSHALNRRLAEMRRDGSLPWARPDSKTQVIFLNPIKSNIIILPRIWVFEMETYFFSEGDLRVPLRRRRVRAPPSPHRGHLRAAQRQDQS